MHRVVVPGPWQVVPELRTYTGTARYRRTVQIPPDWRERNIRLRFGAVDYWASVKVNGATVGEHEGGYLPFDFAIQEVAARGSEATIEVTVSDDMAPDVPKGKQSWYGPLAGMWQSVWLEAVGDLYIESVKIEADPSSGEVTVTPALNRNQNDHSYRLVVRGPNGDEQVTEGLSLKVADPQPWDIDSPVLYSVELAVVRDGVIIDLYTDTFGFRTVSAHGGRIWLNGRPILLAGALDQDYYPDTMCTPPSDAFLQKQFEIAKELGLNCLRCHIKVPDPRYLEWADRTGMLIWSELPNWETLTPEAERRAREILAGMIERDCNHPSIVAWTIINESWGVDLMNKASHRQWLDSMVDFVRAQDSTRIVVDNSACRPNFHVRSDLNDFHFYSSIPDQRERWDEFLERWKDDPGSTYSLNGDAVRRGDEPMVVSEFGNWGLPDAHTMGDGDGTEPWWFDTGKDWADGVVYPHGVEERAREWGLDKIFAGLSALFEASQEHQFESIQYEVEQMRLRPSIAGFVVTEFTDLYWECNGLLDIYRRPKAGHAGYRWIFGSDLPIAGPDRRRCFVGEEIGVNLYVAHASGHDLSEATLRWRCADGSAQGEHAIAVDAWTAPLVGECTLRPERSGRLRVEIELLDRSKDVIGKNWLDINVFDRPTHLQPAWSEERALLDLLDAAQWPIDTRDGVRVTSSLGPTDTPTVQLVHSGDEYAGIRALARTGSPWEGDWAQGMHWFSPVLRSGTPVLPRLDLTCSGVVPDAVLAGCEPRQTLSGMYVGWVHKPVATTATLRPGVVATSFPLFDGGPTDPLAVCLLNNMLDAAATG
jgi:Glycosyl hydrolases family 2, sugar binding domain/Glycosyl hydrolases family 2, TIM barrel domain/Glycosyl hydrolases family 2